MNCTTPGLPVHHHLPEFTQIHVHRVGDAIQPSHRLSYPFPPAPIPPSIRDFSNDDLREPVVVAEVHEEDAAMVAKAEHPAREPDGLSRVGGPEFVASMGAIGMHILYS